MKLLITMLLLLFSFVSHASFLFPEDTTYKIHQGDGYKIIYSNEYAHLVPLAATKLDAIREIYNRDFNWTWDEEAVIILASSKNEMTNGFATQYPSLFSAFFVGGPEVIDEFAVQSWLDVLISHEIAHLYQINTRRPYSSVLKMLFGNASPSLMPPFLYMITPNIFTPTFIMEGNAVMNEGRYKNGGRLYSSTYRALTLQMIGSGKVTAKILMNDHLDWPFGAEKYIIGGYLQSSLAEDHTPEVANQWFYNHSNHFINPFLVNRSFNETFHEGYEDSIAKLNKKMGSLANTQVKTSGQKLAASFSHQNFYKDSKYTYFLTSNLKSWPKLCRFERSRSKLDCNSTGLPSGRLLKWNGKLAVSQIGLSSTISSQAGVYNDNNFIIEGTEDKYYYTSSANKQVYILVSKSFDQPRLYVNDNFYDIVHSSPWVTSDGDIYYFKQKGDEHSLYKNKSLLFSIPGYGGRITAVNDDGSVDFIAAVERGSALFRWNKSRIERLIPSDLVYDASPIDKNSFLVAEVTDSGYEYRIAKSQPSAGQPVLYRYDYAWKSKTPDLTKVLASPSHKTDSDIEYSPYSKLAYNSLDPVLGAYESGPYAIALLSFSDPLQRNQIGIILGGGIYETYEFGFSYLNSVHRLGWFTFATANSTPVTADDPVNKNEFLHLGNRRFYSAGAGLQYPIFAQGRWESNFSTRYRYEGRGATTTTVAQLYDTYYENAFINSLDIAWGHNPSLHWGGYRNISLDLTSKYRGEQSDFHNDASVFAGELKTSYDIWSENIIIAGYKAAYADQDERVVELKQAGLGPELDTAADPTDITKYSSISVPDHVELYKTTVGYIRPINWSLYFQKFPISLRRLALFATYNDFVGRQGKTLDQEHIFYEWTAGADLELLLLHKLPGRFTILGTNTSVKDVPSQLMFRLGGKWNF